VPSHPAARDELQVIAAYQAGRAAPEGAVKLSSNENPFPPLPGVEAAVADSAGEVNRYPDFGSARLLSALSDWLGVEAGQLTLGTGSVAVLGQVVNAMAGRGDEVVFPWRSFEAYPIVVQLSGATQVRVPLRADHRHDLDAMVDAINDRTRVVLVCSPNNPTGTAVKRVELEQFLDAVPARVLVAVDEAYVEFVRDADGQDALDLATSRPNVVVLRTFSKAYGLAGLRVGYGVGPAPLMTEIRKAQLPFGVTDVAERAALAALASRAELLRRVQVLVEERERVERLLLGAASEDFALACERGGVVVRPFAGDGVRVTIGEPYANDRWLAVLRDFLGL
jgi:histidinol-phosphate aminotransferase